VLRVFRWPTRRLKRFPCASMTGRDGAESGRRRLWQVGVQRTFNQPKRTPIELICKSPQDRLRGRSPGSESWLCRTVEPPAVADSKKPGGYPFTIRGRRASRIATTREHASEVASVEDTGALADFSQKAKHRGRQDTGLGSQTEKNHRSVAILGSDVRLCRRAHSARDDGETRWYPRPEGFSIMHLTRRCAAPRP
jgi:hypothetical protein